MGPISGQISLTKWNLNAWILGFCPVGLVGLLAQLLEVQDVWSLASVAPLGKLVLANVRAWVLAEPRETTCEVTGRLVAWGDGFMENPEEAEQYQANRAEVVHLEHRNHPEGWLKHRFGALPPNFLIHYI